jgi:O-antigen/teichoic acid export membrane protein
VQPLKSKSLSTATLIIGVISGLLGALLLLDYLGTIRVLSKDTAIPILIASIATGIIAIILGLIALFSSRQRGKGIAVIGMVLSAFSIGFWIYLEIEHGIFFR